MNRLIGLCLALSLTGPVHGWAQTSVTTWHNDLARTGQNRTETVLTPAKLAAGTFGKLCARKVDGQIYAQPLYLAKVKIHGRDRSVVFVATEHDSVYAFDASCHDRAPLWKTRFLGRGVTAMPCVSAHQPQCDPTVMAPEHGISATPVIDTDEGTIFIAAQSVEKGVYTQKLHALDVVTGMERPDSPVTITATAPNNRARRFDATQGFQRSGLLLLGGVVYVPLASNDSANGWMIGYDARSLAQRQVFCVTPTGHLGGIWSGGAAPAVDTGGSIYVASGNGSFDADSGGPNYGMSALRLEVAGEALTVSDFFAPSHEARLSHRDIDLGSGGIMLAPDQAGSHPHEAFIGFKTGTVFVLDRDNLGHVGDDTAVQHFTGDRQGVYSSLAYWEGSIYLAGVSGPMTQWRLTDGLVGNAPTHESKAVFSYPGSTPSISSDGSKHGIVWAIDSGGKVQGGRPAILRAFDAGDVSNLLYSSDAVAQDAAGAGVKFSVPTIADGRVFVGTQAELDIYGVTH